MAYNSPDTTLVTRAPHDFVQHLTSMVRLSLTKSIDKCFTHGFIQASSCLQSPLDPWCCQAYATRTHFDATRPLSRCDFPTSSFTTSTSVPCARLHPSTAVLTLKATRIWPPQVQRLVLLTQLPNPPPARPVPLPRPMQLTHLHQLR